MKATIWSLLRSNCSALMDIKLLLHSDADILIKLRKIPPMIGNCMLVPRSQRLVEITKRRALKSIQVAWETFSLLNDNWCHKNVSTSQSLSREMWFTLLEELQRCPSQRIWRENVRGPTADTWNTERSSPKLQRLKSLLKQQFAEAVSIEEAIKSLDDQRVIAVATFQSIR